MDNTVHIDAALDRFSDMFDTFKTPPISKRNDTHFNSGREYRIMQLRWMEFGLSLILENARNTLRVIHLYQKDDDDE